MAEHKFAGDASKCSECDATMMAGDHSDKPPAKAAEPPKAANEPTAPTAHQFTELQNEVKQFKERAEKAEGRVDGLEKTNRAMRFGELSKDWAGEKATHLDMLEFMATTCGEDSERFKAYVTKENATAAQLKAAGLFTEIGSSSQGDATGAMAAMETEAIKMSEESQGKLTKEQAFAQIWEKKPVQFREQYREEQRSVN